MRRLAVLGSTRGTDMQAIIDAIANQTLLASIEVVISNKQDAYILERARLHQLNAVFVDPACLSREEYDKKLVAVLSQYQVDLIVLIGYMRILSNHFIVHWRNKIINVHPSLLPAFAGGMDNNVHQAVLNAGVKETGCTVHYVTEDIDAGPILIQKRCAILVDDTVESLKSRVQKLEAEALIEAIIKIHAPL
jgi:phosphoribosylglycinamide formyltransferase-1